MNAYNVTVERTTRSWADITVSANSFDEAQALAASVQHHADYVGFTHTYLVTEVEAVSTAVSVKDALEIIAAGNTDPDRMVELAQQALKTLNGEKA
jgi:hypothetical protein